MPTFRLTPFYKYEDDGSQKPFEDLDLGNDIIVSDKQAQFVQGSKSQLNRLLTDHTEDVIVKEYVDDVPERFTIVDLT